MENNHFRKSGADDFSAHAPLDISALNDINENDQKERARRNASNKKFQRLLACLLVITVVAAPLVGLGASIGTSLASNYFLPRLLNDSAQRESFSFESVHAPLGQVRSADNPLVHRNDYVELVNAVKPSVVTISAIQPTNNQSILGQMHVRTHAGTGILMYETTSRYYIATNTHVIEGAQYVKISIEDSPEIPAVPIGRDDANDLAVIAVYKADAVAAGVHSVTLARFGDSEQSRVGEIVVAIGNAMGEGISVTNGIISALNININVEGIELDVMQTNAAINRGNSGGPLVNVFGEVIGVNTAKVSEQIAEGMGFSIPSHVAKPILERIMREGPEASRPTIGINGNTLTMNGRIALSSLLNNQGIPVAEHIIPDFGFVIAAISPNSPAHNAGMRIEDIITHIDGVEIIDFSYLVSHMQTRSMGETSVFTVVRGGIEIIEFYIVLGDYAPRSF